MVCPYLICRSLLTCSWASGLFWGGVVLVIASAVVKHSVPPFRFAGKVALVTGGSEGIGLEIAKQLVERGCHVYIAARREDVLTSALQTLKSVAEADGLASSHKYGALKVDVTDSDALSREVQKLLALHGRIDLLVCNAGFSYPARFLDIPAQKGEQMMSVNFFGCVNVVRSVLPSMLAARSGRVVLVSSMAGAAPVAGFTLYAPTKAAVRAFAQAMDMEHACLGVRFQVLNPPDVATPGYDEENKTKSEECKKICAMGGAQPFTAQEVALQTLRAVENYSFQINVGFDGKLLGALTAGMEPPTSIVQTVVQTLLLGPIRLISCVYVKLHYRIVRAVRAGR